MTVLLECKNISKEYGNRKILDKVNLKIRLGEKLGVVGTSGAGKTTLINIIYGTETADGKIQWYRDNVKIGYMKQAADYVEGFDSLSGGEKTKKLLTKVLYGNYDMLILDEPTNHLDYLGVNWLVSEINKFKGTVLIISHDRYFLDKCVNNIVEIEDKKLVEYKGNYSEYRKKKKQNYKNKLHQYKQQENIKADINNQIEQLKGWSSKAHNQSAKKAIEEGRKMGGKEFYRLKAKKKDKQIKSRIKRLEKIKVEGIDKPKEEEKIVFNIEKAKKIGSVVVRGTNISKSYGKKVLFKNASFYIKQNEKIGLVGVNGCGKTTLIKALLGEIEVDGDLYLSKNKNIGYISQDIIDLDEEKSIIELFDVKNREELGDIRTKLDLLGFHDDSLNKKVKVLSLGERMKLKILLMVNSNCDILILDEPTNHIDLHVREELEEVLKDFNGTIILITHDRYMLEAICNKLLVFKDNNIFRYEYGMKEYLEKLEKLKKQDKEEKVILDNRISCVLGRLSVCKVGSEEYLKLDEEYRKLLNLKKSH